MIKCTTHYPQVDLKAHGYSYLNVVEYAGVGHVSIASRKIIHEGYKFTSVGKEFLLLSSAKRKIKELLSITEKRLMWREEIVEFDETTLDYGDLD